MKSLIYLSIFLTAVSAAVQSLVPQPYIEGRIINGTIAKQGQFPHQVGLNLTVGKQSEWCGGTLLSERWILTAAHCTAGVDGATVYLGAFNIKNGPEKGQQRIYCPKSNIYVHKQYNPVTTQNDISLIKLPVPIEFNKLIQPALLPKKNETYPTYEGELVVASGWGLTRTNDSSISPQLRYIEVPVMDQNACRRFFFIKITDQMICIRTTEKKSVCNGDTGGSLIHRDEGVNYVIGVTSFVFRAGCQAVRPAVFTRVTSYLDWIEKISEIKNN